MEVGEAAVLAVGRNSRVRKGSADSYGAGSGPIDHPPTGRRDDKESKEAK